MNINEHLAINVMGWDKLDFDNNPGISGTAYLDKANEQIIIEWNPTENIEQAMMCLDKFIGWSLQYDGMEYEFNLSDPECMELEERFTGTDLSQVLCTGMAKITGWKE